MASIDILTQSSLRDLALYGGSDNSALSEQPFLLVDLLHGDTSLPTPEQNHIAAWLQLRPCPVIAIANAASASPLLDAFDVVVDDLADAQTLIANIQHTPIAAMTLVQVLRTTAALPVAQ